MDIDKKDIDNVAVSLEMEGLMLSSEERLKILEISKNINELDSIKIREIADNLGEGESLFMKIYEIYSKKKELEEKQLEKGKIK